MGNVISAASEDASDGGTSRLVAATESSATAVDAATTGLPEQTSQDEAPDASEAPLDRLYPSTETFGEQAGWSSPRERESDTALVLSASCTPEEKVAPCTPDVVHPRREGPRLILATPSLLAATRTLTSPAWLSSPSDEEQPLPIPLEYDGGSLPVETEPRREPQVTVGPRAEFRSAAFSEAPLMASRRWSPFARGLLVAGVILWLVSALLTLVTWRLSRDPLGSNFAQNVSALVRQLERLASGYAEGASNDSVAENLTHGTVLVDQMVEAVPVGGDEQPLI
ncbi:hypothetical protein HPB51_007277 [Rhipicephalus microplus]|uniref:Uncharacterized protein n=1 Tax=Rhipicephalus microplus TaxID=6941 RepID=A0A9J6EZJ9_RHIMP|nr:hypothetical protein HPB51_007277 [Rhipicephalus microplus]